MISARQTKRSAAKHSSKRDLCHFVNIAADLSCLEGEGVISARSTFFRISLLFRQMSEIAEALLLQSDSDEYEDFEVDKVDQRRQLVQSIAVSIQQSAFYCLQGDINPKQVVFNSTDEIYKEECKQLLKISSLNGMIRKHPDVSHYLCPPQN